MFTQGDSNGLVNVNVEFQPQSGGNGGETAKGAIRTGGNRKGSGNPQAHSTTKLKVSIAPPRNGSGVHRQAIPIVDSHVLPPGVQPGAWLGFPYPPHIIRGPDGQPVIMDRPCATGESSSSSTQTVKRYPPVSYISAY